MSLDFTLKKVMPTEVFEANITHNLNKMAEEAGVYGALWRPEENGYVYAQDIIEVLQKGIEDLKARPEHYKQFDSPNGWGTYPYFVEFCEKVLQGCIEFPDAVIEVDR